MGISGQRVSETKRWEHRKQRGAGLLQIKADEPVEKRRFAAKLITPAILDGADNKHGDAELRLSSIMAGLRFWWRALAWSRILRALPDAQEAARLELLLEWHADLFGAAGGHQRPAETEREYGIGRVSARLVEFCVVGAGKRKFDDTNLGYESVRNKNGLKYCAGQGLFKRSYEKDTEHFNRRVLGEGTWFEFELLIRGKNAGSQWLCDFDAQSTDPPTIAEAVHTFLIFGSLGARGRRGYGGLTMCTPQMELANPLTEAQRIIESCATPAVQHEDDLPYTCFSSFSRVLLWRKARAPAATAQDAHNDAGFRFLKYRGNGFWDKGQYVVARGKKAGKIFVQDKHWFKNMVKVARDNGQFKEKDGKNLPRRAVFGLPHHYASPKLKQKLELPGRKSSNIRRASPLMFKVIGLPGKNGGASEYASLWLSMPARFLPAAHSTFEAVVWWREKASKKDDSKAFTVNCDVDWQVLDDFMNVLAAEEKLAAKKLAAEKR